MYVLVNVYVCIIRECVCMCVNTSTHISHLSFIIFITLLPFYVLLSFFASSPPHFFISSLPHFFISSLLHCLHFFTVFTEFVDSRSSDNSSSRSSRTHPLQGLQTHKTSPRKSRWQGTYVRSHVHLFHFSFLYLLFFVHKLITYV